jgi:hypothetical protein
MLLSGPIKLDQLGVNVVLRFGVEGAQATILPLALVLLGILSIAQPVHRIFYGVIALAISVYSIAGVNLGGWVVGFLLGVIGGIVVVSWAPPAAVAEDEGAEPAGEADDADLDVDADTEDDAPASDTDVAAPAAPVADGDAPHAGREPVADTEAIPQVETLSTALRALSQKSAAVVVVSAMAFAGMSMPAATSDAGTQQDDSFWCVVFGACDDEGSTTDPSASPSPSTSDSGGSEPGTGADEDSVGDKVDDVTDGVTGPAGGDAEGGQAGDPADGDADGAKSDDTSECKEPTQDGEVPPEAEDSAPSDPCGEVDPQETIEEALHTELGTCVKVSFGGKYDLNIDLPGQCGTREDGSVFSLPADLESRDLTIPLTGINGIGLANVPVKNGGERRDAIKISADKVVVDGFWLKSYAYDHGTTAGTDTRANFVSLEGNAHMYVSSIHANLPDGQDLLEVATKVLEGASLIELLLTATDARMGFIGATSDVQVWDTFREQVWGDPTRPIGKGPTAGTP